jgi:hypothetical protein
MRTLLILGAILLAGCGRAETPDITIHDAWTRATNAADGPAAAYLTISNKGGADRLLSVESDKDTPSSLHSSAMHDGIMEMRPLPDGIAVQAHGDTILSPQGTHIMLERIGPLTAGKRVELTLHFEKSGEISVPVSVVAPGAR